MPRTVAAALVSLLSLAAPAIACPFCAGAGPAPGPNQSLQLSDATVQAKVLGRRLVFRGDNDAKPVAKFEVTKVLAGSIAPVGRVFEITAPRGALGDARQAVLMLAADGRDLALVDAYPDPDGRLFEYLAASNKIAKADHAAKVALFAAHLEHDIPDISDDAHRQFVDIPYEAVHDARGKLPLEKLRTWLADPKISAVRKGLYGLMLGTAGRPEDAETLRKALAMVKDNAIGTGGVLAGLCVLTGKSGETLTAFLRDTSRPAPQREGVVGVIRFLWDRTEPAKRGELLDLFRLALSQADIAPAYITELALLSEFSLTDEIKAYWQDPARLTPRGRTAVILYQKSLPKEDREAFRKWLADHPVSILER
jgi:hypothetical protein